MTNRSLVIQSAPSLVERLPGYLLRMAENNGYDSPRWILPAHGVRRIGHLGAPPAPDALAAVLGLSAKTVDDLAYTPSRPSFLRVFGHEISVRKLSWRYPRVCPQCLRDLQVVSGLWDLPLVQACPFHACQLLRECRTCGEALIWQRASVVRCRCGADLREQAMPPASRAAVDVARRIARACGLANVPAATGFDTSGLGLDDLLYLIDFLGRRSKPSFASGAYAGLIPHGQLPDLAETAGQILEDPVAVICEIIAATADIQSEVKIGKLIEKYFFSMSKYGHPEVRAMLAGIGASVRATFDGRFSAGELQALGASDKRPQASRSRHRLTALSGLSKGKAAAALDKAGIRFLPNSARTIAFSMDNPLLGEEALFQDYCREFSADLLPARDAAFWLDLPDEYSVPEFARRGLIDEVPVGQSRLYSAASLDRLFARLHERVGSSAGLSDAAIPSSPIEAIVAVLNGDFALQKLAGGRGLAQFGILDRSGVIRLLDTDDGCVSRGAAAAYLQISPSVIASLLREGLLPRKRALCARTYALKVSRAGSSSSLNRVLYRDDVERFSTNYLLSGAIGAVLQCKHPTVGPALAKLGVLPVARCKHAGAHVSIWSRAQVEAALGMPIPQAAWPSEVGEEDAGRS